MEELRKQAKKLPSNPKKIEVPYESQIIDLSEEAKLLAYTKKLGIGIYKDLLNCKELSPFLVKDHKNKFNKFLEDIKFKSSSKYDGYKELYATFDLVEFYGKEELLHQKMYGTKAKNKNIDGSHLWNWFEKVFLLKIVEKYKFDVESYDCIENIKYPQISISGEGNMMEWYISVLAYIKEE